MKSYIHDSTTNLRNEVSVLEPEQSPSTPGGYSRVSPGVDFSAMVKPTNKVDREYFEGLIEDVSLGGMFIEIARPFPKGSVVDIRFKSRVENEDRPVIAKGLIRWTRKWKKPHGMGIDFIEFNGLGATPFNEWFKSHFQKV
jgi:hypothetical protein